MRRAVPARQIPNNLSSSSLIPYLLLARRKLVSLRPRTNRTYILLRGRKPLLSFSATYAGTREHYAKSSLPKSPQPLRGPPRGEAPSWSQRRPQRLETARDGSVRHRAYGPPRSSTAALWASLR